MRAAAVTPSGRSGNTPSRAPQSAIFQGFPLRSHVQYFKQRELKPLANIVVSMFRLISDSEFDGRTVGDNAALEPFGQNAMNRFPTAIGVVER